MKNNLIPLLDQSYPGANDLFDSPARSDGSQKWVDFVYTYWHVDCVRENPFNAFYRTLSEMVQTQGLQFSVRKKRKSLRAFCDLIAVFPER